MKNDKMITFRSLVVAAFSALMLFSALPVHAQLDARFSEQDIQSIVSRMTPEEKSLMVTGAKRRNVFPQPLPGFKLKDITGVGGYTYPFLAYGIPSIMLCDGPAGVRIAPRRVDDLDSYYCTAFPVATLMASTWNTDLTETIGSAMGKEALEYGIDILLAPGMNIQRDPLGGRNFEYYSEDPYLTGKMAAAVVKGIQSQGVGASIKHFAVNNQETNRRIIDAVLSERALREIYLQGFKIAVKESMPWTVMSSYNKINGVYTSESRALLETILREEWGFDGFVLTDWYGGTDPVAQVNAGNDLLMPGLEVWSNQIDSALRNRAIEESVINRNIERILKVTTQTSTYKNYDFSNKPDLKSHAGLAREAAAEGVVLLKNENRTLPFSADIKTIAAFGNYSYKLTAGGTGSGMVNYKHSVSLAEGLVTAGYQLDQELRDTYTAYLQTGKPQDLKEDSLITAMRKPDKVLEEIVFEENVIREKARTADVAIITIMRVFGEGGDRKLNNSFHLFPKEKQLIETVSRLFSEQQKKTLVVLNIGGVIEMASWQYMADAILLPWQPGQEGGHALADIITGKVNPSGRLATTIPVRYEDLPTAGHFPGTPVDKPLKVVHEEGIYVGYRYFGTFGVQPLYDFGHGLSYTRFDYSDVRVKGNPGAGTFKLSVKITNKGDMAGKEVVQVYIGAPATRLDKPEKELKAFGKTRLLQPGESQILTFSISSEELASFDPSEGAWIAEKGRYEISIGSSYACPKVKKNILLKREQMVEKVHRVLLPKETIRERRPEKPVE